MNRWRIGRGILSLAFLLSLLVLIGGSSESQARGLRSKVQRSKAKTSLKTRVIKNRGPSTARLGARRLSRPTSGLRLRTAKKNSNELAHPTTVASRSRTLASGRAVKSIGVAKPLSRSVRAKTLKGPRRSSKPHRVKRSALASSPSTKTSDSRIQKLATKAGKALQKSFTSLAKRPWIARTIARYTKWSQASTRKLDALQARAPPWLAKTMSVLRTYSLPSMGGFITQRVKRDPKFLGGILAGSAALSYGILPGAIVIGMNPVLSGVLNALTTPVVLGIMVLRERHLRSAAGKKASLYQSARSIFTSYNTYAVQRHAELSRVAALASP